MNKLKVKVADLLTVVRERAAEEEERAREAERTYRAALLVWVNEMQTFYAELEAALVTNDGLVVINHGTVYRDEEPVPTPKPPSKPNQRKYYTNTIELLEKTTDETVALTPGEFAQYMKRREDS